MAGMSVPIAAPGGGAFSGYLAVPGQGRGPGLILLQEIFGVNAPLRAAADLFAEEGYVVLAPDLFWRIEPGIDLADDPAGLQKAFGYRSQFDVDQGVRDVGAAVEALKNRPECTGQVAAVGFCLGGLLAYLTAARLPVDAAVAFYGGRIDEHLAEAANIRCP